MIGCFRNFIKKGGDVFLHQNDMFGNSLVLLAFQLIEKVYANNQSKSDDTDTCSVTLLLIAMIENYVGKIDCLVPQILNISVRNIQVSILHFKFPSVGKLKGSKSSTLESYASYSGIIPS